MYKWRMRPINDEWMNEWMVWPSSGQVQEENGGLPLLGFEGCWKRLA